MSLTYSMALLDFLMYPTARALRAGFALWQQKD